MARVAAIVPDLFFASKVKETLAAAGHEQSERETLHRNDAHRLGRLGGGGHRP